MLGKIAPSRGLFDPQPAAESIMIAPWPKADASQQDAMIEQRFAHFQKVLGAVISAAGEIAGINARLGREAPDVCT